MILNFPIHKTIRSALKRESGQFLASISIRSLGMGMIVLYEPIYIFQYFEGSIPLTLLYFALIHGAFGLLAVFGGEIMSRFGLKKTMLSSHFFYWSYFVTLFFLDKFFALVILAIILRALGMMFFWPAFHTTFIRNSEKKDGGKEVGKMNVFFSLPNIIAPLIGGVILSLIGYSGLFIVVLMVFFSSAIPLMMSKEVYVNYQDSYIDVFKRAMKKNNRKMSLSFISYSVEGGINAYIWPLFMFSLTISFAYMGAITTFSLFLTALFTLYMGKVSGKIMNRVEFLNIGSVLTAIAWIIKYFVKTTFDAFLAHGLYRICRTSSSIPWQAFFYERFSLKGDQSDEYVVYYETVANLSRFVFFGFLAILFTFVSDLSIAFLIAAFLSFGLILIGAPPRVRIKK